MGAFFGACDRALPCRNLFIYDGVQERTTKSRTGI
jgi:hypothetical protein